MSNYVSLLPTCKQNKSRKLYFGPIKIELNEARKKVKRISIMGERKRKKASDKQ